MACTTGSGLSGQLHPDKDTAEDKSKESRGQKRHVRGGNPQRPGALRWKAQQEGHKVFSLPRGDGHVPPSQRSEDGQRREKIRRIAYFGRNKTIEELQTVLNHIRHQKHSVEVEAQTLEKQSLEKEPSVSTVQVQTEPQEHVAVATATVLPLASSVVLKRTPKPLPKPLPKPPSKLMTKTLAKSPAGLNEASQFADPANLVDWHVLAVGASLRGNVLKELGQKEHIKSRMPRFEEMLEQVQKKCQEDEMKAAAKQLKLTVSETQVLLACPS